MNLLKIQYPWIQKGTSGYGPSVILSLGQVFLNICLCYSGNMCEWVMEFVLSATGSGVKSKSVMTRMFCRCLLQSRAGGSVSFCLWDWQCWHSLDIRKLTCCCGRRAGLVHLHAHRDRSRALRTAPPTRVSPAAKLSLKFLKYHRLLSLTTIDCITRHKAPQKCKLC